MLIWALLGSFGLAQDSKVASLYKYFSSNEDLPVFITFERNGLIPERHKGTQDITFKDGTTGKLHFLDKDYISFCFYKSNYVIAFSESNPVLNVNEFTSSEELYGFDGTSYWMLDLTMPITVSNAGPTNTSRIPSSLSFNRLILIPKEEALLAQKRFQNDVTLAAIRGLAAECWSVANVGCEFQLLKHPRTENSKIVIEGIDGEMRNATIVGDQAMPGELIYDELADGKRLEVKLDQHDDSIVIQRSVKTNIYFQSRYRLLAFGMLPIDNSAALYSWRSYKDKVGNIIGAYLTNGAMVQIDFSKQGQMKLGDVTSPAIPNMQSKGLPKAIIYVLFTLVTASAVFLAYRTKQTKRNGK